MAVARDYLNFGFPQHCEVDVVQDKIGDMKQWVKDNNLKAQYMGVFMGQTNFNLEIRWLVECELEKTMFRLKWDE